ncbi:AMP-binding enzyme, partial [Mycobacterium sp.]|uniref:AMP-binding enzyme n=1 Tax=Mycobacterium sp. TaxID=1785 RepID=UPI003F9D1B04
RAYVVAADPAHPLYAAELRTFCRSQLAGFKVPRDWRVVSELPRNAVGKLRRRLLADEAWADAFRQVIWPQRRHEFWPHRAQLARLARVAVLPVRSR